MKISVNPIAKLIARAEELVNLNYAASPQNAAYERKRRLAEQVVAGGAATADFAEAAIIEGLTVEDLADLILSKPDPLMVRENARRAVIVRLRAAKNQTEIDQILRDGKVQYATQPPAPQARKEEL